MSTQMRYCFVCGAELGVYADRDYGDLDTCGSIRCEREAWQTEEAERRALRRMDVTDTGKRKGKVTYHGTLPDTDPIYKGGWNFLAGVNLPNAKRAPEKPEGDDGEVDGRKGVDG
jgi:hypothetical protein